MLIDSRQIAREIGDRIQSEIAIQNLNLTLLVVQVGEDPASTSFIKMKKAFAERVGIKVKLVELSEDGSTNDVKEIVADAGDNKEISGIIVQLPLPKSFNTREILDLIPPNKDPDLLGSEAQARFAAGESEILPPVVAAVSQIFDNYQVATDLADIAVVGYGQLVGQPVGKWLHNMGIDFALITSENENPEAILSKADIIVSGVGKPGLIKPHMIKDDVVLIDAGTSESPEAPVGPTNRGLVGDADPRCAEKASLMTPVPGGVGPIAVAKLFENLLALSLSRPAAK